MRPSLSSKTSKPIGNVLSDSQLIIRNSIMYSLDSKLLVFPYICLQYDYLFV
jgi:hypothetical protein